MSVTEHATISTTLIRSEDGNHRYLLSKVWDESKGHAMLIMLCAGSADTVNIDTTTMLVIKNLKALDFGGVSICNLFSNSDKETDEENDRVILDTAKDSAPIIFAWGTGSATNPAAQRRISEVLEMLKPYQKHTFCIATPDGKNGQHPLSPKLRDSWVLVPFFVPPNEAAPQEKAKTPFQKTEKNTVSPKK